MMMDIFTNPQMPFYKFGDLFFLGKIKTEHFAPFITERFAATGKSIDSDACLEIISLADNHPYYVQQLAQISWLRADDGHCSVQTVRQSHEALVEQLSLLFVNLTETLTNQQLALLHAMTAGETAFTSAEVMRKYRISSPMPEGTLLSRLQSRSGLLIYSFWRTSSNSMASMARISRD